MSRDLLKSQFSRSTVGQDFFVERDNVFEIEKSEKGLTEEIVRHISKYKGEPDWMLQKRLEGLRLFHSKPIPNWGLSDLLHQIPFHDIHYFVKATERVGESWDDVPQDIKNTFERLGIPQAERDFLAGVSAQFESEVVYHKVREDLEQQGVLFFDMDTGLKKYPDIVRQYFGTVIPAHDNKFAALNTAVWSGGSFIYVPPHVEVKIPVQAYFRINKESMGQFERTLIIADRYSKIHYIEGCTAPIYRSSSLHSAVVELVALEGATIRYTTIQNWATNIYNLVTKRAHAHAKATVEWVDGNLGSYLTMKYPAIYLLGEGAHGEILSVAYAGTGMHQDAGSKIIHAAPRTTSVVTSKSVVSGGGHGLYRGLVEFYPSAEGSSSQVQCDGLVLDDQSRTDTYPVIHVKGAKDVKIGHEATVSRIDEETLFYLQSRGFEERQAKLLVVDGFIEVFSKELPMEYALELNQLIQMQIEGI